MMCYCNKKGFIVVYGFTLPPLMKKKLLPIFICSLLYLAGCATKEDTVKPGKETTEMVSKPLSARKPRGSNSGARIGYSSWQKFTMNGRPTGDQAVDIAVGDYPGVDWINIITFSGVIYGYDQLPSSANFNPTNGRWRKIDIYSYDKQRNLLTSITFPACNGRAPKIAVDAAGAPMIIDCSGGVYYTTNQIHSSGVLVAVPMHGVLARDIGYGGRTTYVTEGITGNGNIYKWNGFAQVWEHVPGQVGASISVDQAGRPWVLWENGPAYYRTTDGVWHLAGAANGQGRDIGASNSDWVNCVGTASSNNVFVYDFWNNYWYQPYGSGFGIRVDTDREGYTYLLNNEPSGNIFTH